MFSWLYRYSTYLSWADMPPLMVPIERTAWALKKDPMLALAETLISSTDLTHTFHSFTGIAKLYMQSWPIPTETFYGVEGLQSLGQTYEPRSTFRQGLAIRESLLQPRQHVFTGHETVAKSLASTTQRAVRVGWFTPVASVTCKVPLADTTAMAAYRYYDRGFFFPERRDGGVVKAHRAQAPAVSRTGLLSLVAGRSWGASAVSYLGYRLGTRARGWAAALYRTQAKEGTAMRPRPHTWLKSNRSLTSIVSAKLATLSGIKANLVKRSQPLLAMGILTKGQIHNSPYRRNIKKGLRLILTRVRRLIKDRRPRNKQVFSEGMRAAGTPQIGSLLPKISSHLPVQRASTISSRMSHKLHLESNTISRLEHQIYETRRMRLDFDFRALMGQFRQPQVRYRPGMATYWRSYRQSFCTTFWAPWGHRQKRLTAYITRIRRVASFSYFKLVLLSVASLAYLCHLTAIPSLSAAHMVVRSGWVHLNGRTCINPFAQVYGGDIVTWRGLSGLQQTQSLGEIAQRYPLWRPSQVWEATLGWVADTPAYLEVDELTSSVCLLFEPTDWGFLFKQPYPNLPFLTLKCYNWKYIT